MLGMPSSSQKKWSLCVFGFEVVVRAGLARTKSRRRRRVRMNSVGVAAAIAEIFTADLAVERF